MYVAENLQYSVVVYYFLLKKQDVRFMQHEANGGDVQTQVLLDNTHEAQNDGDAQTQVLLDSTHEAQNSFAFTSFTDLMTVLLLLLLNFVELVLLFLFAFLIYHLPLQGPSEIDDMPFKNFFQVFNLVAALVYQTFCSFGMTVEHLCANGLL